MIPFQIYQNRSQISDQVYNHWYARTVSTETIDLKTLADRMSNHNSPFSRGAILGILTDMVGCIKELLLEGKNVKINNLAIFSTSIENEKGGAISAEEFSVIKNVKCVKMNALATGELSKSSLNIVATLQERSSYNSPKSSSLVYTITHNDNEVSSPYVAEADSIVTIVARSGYSVYNITSDDGNVLGLDKSDAAKGMYTFLMIPKNVTINCISSTTSNSPDATKES